MEQILKELEGIEKSGFGIVGYSDKYKMMLLYALENIKFEEHMFYFSGGGFLHLFLHLNDKKIISIHFADLNIEMSYRPWNCLDDYLDMQEEGEGFGFEYNSPNYDQRILGDDWTPKEFHNLFK